jgi:septal ring factor EnvC (AmiA/AmiB activator)
MDILQLLLGVAAGGALSYFYYQKNNKTLKKDLHEVNKQLSETKKRSSQECKELESQLLSKDMELKKYRKEIEESEDIIHDLNSKNSKSKKVSNSLKEENVKLTSSLREYEMLYNSKKDEIEKLQKLIK